MTIGIDADGVLFDYVRTCASYVNSRCFIGATHENACEFDVLKAWGVPHLKHVVDRHFSQWHVVRNMPMLPAALHFIEEVRRITNDDFCIITACPAMWHAARERALVEDFDIPSNRIHFSYDKSMFKVDALVDDYHQNLNNFSGWRILLDRPWNQDTEGVAVDRAYTYGEVCAKINRIVNWNK